MEKPLLLHKLSILLTEDSAIILGRIKEMLYEMDEISNIYEAISGTEAMMLLDSKVPDVILLDINLPGKNGIEILKEVRRRQLNTYVIMLTNYSDLFYRKLCKEAGADYFFDKSTEFEKIPVALKYISSTKTRYSIPVPSS